MKKYLDLTGLSHLWEKVVNYVQGQKVSPAFTGTPTAPTAPDGTSTTQLATTEFVQNALVDIDSESVFVAIRNVTKHSELEAAYKAGKTILAKQSSASTANFYYLAVAPETSDNAPDQHEFEFRRLFSGTYLGSNKTVKIRTMSLRYISGDGDEAEDSAYEWELDDIVTSAPVESPTFSGKPTAPTPDSGDNSGRIATTEFVSTAITNERSNTTVTTRTLSASGWSNGAYSLESIYPSSTYNVEVDINGDAATVEQYSAWSEAQLCGSNTANKIIALGDVPTVAIPVIVKAVKK